MKRRYMAMLGILFFYGAGYGVMRFFLDRRYDALNKDTFTAYWALDALAIIVEHYFVYFVTMIIVSLGGFFYAKFYSKDNEVKIAFKVMTLFVTAITGVFLVALYVLH